VRYITVGNLTIDEILLPQGQYQNRQCGGNCLYAAVGAHIWSSDVGIVSLIGNDYPAEWLRTVEEAGIDISGIVVLEKSPSMAAAMAYSPDSERYVLEEETIGRNEFDKTPAEWADWLFYSPRIDSFPASYGQAEGIHFAPMPVQAHYPLVRALQKPGRRLTLDSPWWDGAAHDFRPHLPLLNALDALLPSLAEVRVFLNEDVDSWAALRSLVHLGAAATVVKMGVAGCLVCTAHDEQIIYVPVFPALTVDPTGAGDAFCGGFLVGLVETGDPVEAARYGTVSASFVVEGFSSLHALNVPRDQVELRLQAVQPRRIGDKH
jgi:ribokinase